MFKNKLQCSNFLSKMTIFVCSQPGGIKRSFFECFRRHQKGQSLAGAKNFHFGAFFNLNFVLAEAGVPELIFWALRVTRLEAHCVPAGGAPIFSKFLDTWFTLSGLHPAWPGPKSVKNSVLGHGPLLKPRPKPKTFAKIGKDSLRRQ